MLDRYKLKITSVIFFLCRAISTFNKLYSPGEF